MRFCPKCGSIMVPKKEGGKTVLVCPRCGYKLSPNNVELSLYKKRDVIEHTEKEKTIVISEKEEMRGAPITRDVVCPRCGNREAYYWFVQTRAADEPATRFFKCTKCGYVWREYD